MLTWNEIYKLNDRKAFEREYQVRKCYDRMLPTVDKLYDCFLLCAAANGYANISKSGARVCWARLIEDSKGTIIETWIKQMNSACCSDELKEYFNNKIRKQEDIVYAD